MVSNARLIGRLGEFVLTIILGMNGVLAKPFTKEGMWKSVKNNLSHLMKNPPSDSELGHGTGYFMGGGYMNTSALKFDTPTPPSGTAPPSWSPSGALPQASPLSAGLEQGYGFVNGANQYSLATGHRPTYSNTMQSADSSSGRLSEVDSPPGKRQRNF
jgi:osomolarity two-component system, response regulator SKN7